MAPVASEIVFGAWIGTDFMAHEIPAPSARPPILRYSHRTMKAAMMMHEMLLMNGHNTMTEVEMAMVSGLCGG